MSKNTVRVYDTITKKYVEVEVTEKVRTYYNRTQWNIDDKGNTITVTNADSVKLVYPSMLRKIFGAAYGDVVKEEITYKLSEPAKRLLSAVYNKEYIKGGSVEQILDSTDGKR